ncbi:MAG: response regulator [Pseudomonadota bacterium]
MPETLDDFLQNRPPTPDRPLLGQTVLLVEDSRFASEAIRLLCLRSGARIRRADTLRSAARHLRTYHPSVLIVDMGLPDGSGLDLVAELSRAAPRVPVILATSGDDAMETAALSAGADGFLSKPMVNLAAFQEAVLSRLPEDVRPNGLRPVPMQDVDPDRVAYRDDLAHIVEILGDKTDPATLDYATAFLGGVAKSAEDGELLGAVDDLSRCQKEGAPTGSAMARVSGLIEERLSLPQAV